jgi:hypothetical protein
MEGGQEPLANEREGLIEQLERVSNLPHGSLYLDCIADFILTNFEPRHQTTPPLPPKELEKEIGNILSGISAAHSVLECGGTILEIQGLTEAKQQLLALYPTGQPLPWIKDVKCPACGLSEMLFVGSGGYITCSNVECPNPDYAEALAAHHQVDLEEAERKARIDELNKLPLDGAIDQCYIALAKHRDSRLAQLQHRKSQEPECICGLGDKTSGYRTDIVCPKHDGHHKDKS